MNGKGTQLGAGHCESGRVGFEAASTSGASFLGFPGEGQKCRARTHSDPRRQKTDQTRPDNTAAAVLSIEGWEGWLVWLRRRADKGALIGLAWKVHRAIAVLGDAHNEALPSSLHHHSPSLPFRWTEVPRPSAPLLPRKSPSLLRQSNVLSQGIQLRGRESHFIGLYEASTPPWQLGRWSLWSLWYNAEMEAALRIT